MSSLILTMFTFRTLNIFRDSWTNHILLDFIKDSILSAVLSAKNYILLFADILIIV